MEHNFSNTFQGITIAPLKKENIEEMRVLRNKNRHCFVYSGIINPEEQEKWYNNYLTKPNDYVFSVYLQDLWIGVCSLYNIVGGSAEFGRLLIDKEKTDEKNPGLKTTLCAVQLAFETLDIGRVHLQVYEDNISAYKTYIKAGFVPYNEESDSKGQKLICMELCK